MTTPTISLPPLPEGGRYTIFIRPVVPASTLNSQPTLNEIQKNGTAYGKPLPLAFGSCQIGGLLGPVDYDAGTWTVVYFLGQGEISAINDVWLNGEAPAAGVQITKYVGSTSQVADPWVEAAISGYADDYIIHDPAGDLPVNYIVLQYTDDDYDTWPTVVADVDGLLLPNPRKLNGADRYEGDGSTTWGVVNTPITLSGAFRAGVSFTREDRSGDQVILLGNDSGTSDFVSFNAADHGTYPDAINVHYNGALEVFEDALDGVAAGQDVRVTVELTGSDLAVLVNGVLVDTRGVTVADFTLDSVGAYNGGTLPMPADMLIGKVRIEDRATGLEWRWDMAEGSGTTCTNSHTSTEVDDYTLTLNAASWTTVALAKEFTSNPGMHLAAFIEDRHWGRAATCDQYGAIDVMDYCDDRVAGEARRESYLVLKEPQDVDVVLDIMRGYAGCFVIQRGDVYVPRPDKREESVMDITPANIELDSVEIETGDATELPTVIRAWYTDTTVTPWRRRLCDPVMAAGVEDGTTPWRLSIITLDGIDRHSQAYRECIERLNKLYLSDLSVNLVLTDEGWKLEQGDVVTLTHPLGLTAKPMRKMDPQSMASMGRWSQYLVEYDPAAYSNSVVNAPTYADGNLPSSGLNLRGSRVYRQSSAPSGAGEKENDIWVDTSDQERKHVHDGSGWVNVDESLVSVTGTKQDSDFTAAAFGRYPIDTETNGTITMTLPSSPETGTTVHFFDAEGYFDQAHLNISSPDKKILELNEDFEVDRRYFSGGLQFIDDTIGWTLI